MAQDLYQYEKMVERALRGVVREALERAARDGLRGAHHFYIAFSTKMPGVVIPEQLRSRYTDDMTIVLQHQYWDLDVGPDSFSVTLSFQKQLERMTIPFAAVRSFADPSVNFALEFAAPEELAATEATTKKKPAPNAPGVPAPIASVPAPAPASKPADKATTAEVVTLDSFRKR